MENIDWLITTHSLPTTTRHRLRQVLQQLTTLPNLGRELDGRWVDHRVVLGPWRWMLVVYRIHEANERVVVVTVQGARDAGHGSSASFGTNAQPANGAIGATQPRGGVMIRDDRLRAPPMRCDAGQREHRRRTAGSLTMQSVDEGADHAADRPHERSYSGGHDEHARRPTPSYAEHAGRSLALPIAGATVWTAVGLAAFVLEQQTAMYPLLFATGAIFPLALVLARILDERLLDNPSPLAGLMGRSVLMVNLLWAVHLTVLTRDPTYVPLTLGIGLGVHWLVFSWVAGHPVGTMHAVVRTVPVTAAWWGAPDHRVSAVFAAVVVYLLAIRSLGTRPGPRRRRIAGPRSTASFETEG